MTITHRDVMLATSASKPFDRRGWIFDLCPLSAKSGHPANVATLVALVRTSSFARAIQVGRNESDQATKR